MKKIVAIIEHCKACPNATYARTVDPEFPRIYLGCNLAKRSFEFQMLLKDRPPIPDWCPSLDAEGMITFAPSNADPSQIRMEPIHAHVYEQFQAWRENEKNRR